LVPEQLNCTFAVTYPSNSKLTAIGLFQLVWHFLKLFGIFVHLLGPGNPDVQQ